MDTSLKLLSKALQANRNKGIIGKQKQGSRTTLFANATAKPCAEALYNPVAMLNLDLEFEFGSTAATPTAHTNAWP